MINTSDLLAILETIPLFANLNDRALATLVGAAYLARVPRGRTLFNQGEGAEAVYVVRSGCIAILFSTLDGRELIINEICAGEYFGELGVLTDQPRSADAVAREASELLVIPREAFLAALDQDPKLTRKVLKTTALRLRVSGERESALAFLGAPERLAWILLHLDRVNSAIGYVTISQEEIAQHIGVTRQTVAKTLSQWRRAGWLITGRGKIVLLNRAALRRLTTESEI